MASTAVDQHSDADGNSRIVREEGNCLFAAVFEHLKIPLGETFDVPARRIDHRRSHVDEFYVNGQCVSLFLRGRRRTEHEQYKWNPASTAFMAHSASAAEQAVFSNTKGHADPDGPAVRITKDAPPDASYEIPAASIMVVRGKLR